eukprot:4756437-Amphidinium_carterae.1
MPGGKRQFDWESTPPAAKKAKSFAWEGSPSAGGGDPVDSSEDEDDPQECFFNFLVDGLNKGEFNAKQVCLIAHWATASGARGPVSKLAKPPTAGSGDFRRHLDQ